MIENKRIVKLDENQFRSIIYESIRYALLNEMVYGNEGSGFNQNNKYYGVPPYSKYCYFGDCRNTVDGDEYYGPIWDATQMSGFLLQCKIIDNDMVINKIVDGDRPIPMELINELNNNDNIICVIDDYQKIMVIYVISLDIHYFFDCER